MYITDATIVNSNEICEKKYLKIEDGKIVEIGNMSDLKVQPDEELKSMNNDYVLPGFIEEHVHGTNNSDIMDGTNKSLENISNSLLSEGVTSYLPTTMTDDQAAIENALININEYCSKNQKEYNAEILGVHLEGPFISCEKSGGQNPSFIHKPSQEMLENFNECSGYRIKMITYAPEETNTKFTEYLVSKNIVPSAGHSVVSYKELLPHIQAGLSNVTHLFNAMSPITHRNPGLAFAGLVDDRLNVEMIVDGHHLDKEVVDLAFKNKKAEGISLITDSMRAKNCPDGKYIHGGMQVEKHDGTVRLPDGTLSGSVLHISESIKNMMQFTGCNIKDIVKMTSENQAKKLDCYDRKGSIEVSKDADLVVLNKNYELIYTFKFGKKVYS
ncbi:N-acetylglucosamine-6-phosphate deacetylase [Companilactobacillus formosensis]|jgi:N-acetylglucosamine-6-phosphate deacetylase|uniref:N-acetylglucosamine-6-phosphate deacetylase n=1 Tax=Companilactobacillus formosensis TaxID=1617889 RepID=UPI000E6574B6|nr:N-acetylglucosamine-6-phosphate deacetylase [Companilactobacillus formosensis]